MHTYSSQRTKLIDLISSDLGQPEKSGAWLKWSCPFHADGHSPSLTIKGIDDTGFHCFGCGKSGNSFTWLTEYRNMSSTDVRAYLVQAGVERIIAPLTKKAEGKPLPLKLQPAWQEIIEVCEKQLWKDVGARARKYLLERGLKEDTLQSPFFRIGYSIGQKIAGVFVPAGIVIPCFSVNSNLDIDFISYIKVRRRDEKPKYQKLSGNGCDLRGLFGVRLSLISNDVVLLAEGELDAMLLEQEVPCYIGAGTLGSASERFDFGRFGRYLIGAKHVFIAYDADAAGQKGADYWKELSPRIRQVNIPEGINAKTSQPIKDITDIWQAGLNLEDWVWGHLVDNGIEPTDSAT
jgi:hypothetical protein